MLAEQTGAPAAVAASLAYLTDRWDGKGPLRRAAADAIPLSMRIVHVAIDRGVAAPPGGRGVRGAADRRARGPGARPRGGRVRGRGRSRVAELHGRLVGYWRRPSPPNRGRG